MASRCQGCLAVILEQVQFLNNSAIHGGGLDINASLPNPVIITASQFTYNSARVLPDDAGNSSLRAILAGNGGAIRCLGGMLDSSVGLHDPDLDHAVHCHNPVQNKQPPGGSITVLCFHRSNVLCFLFHALSCAEVCCAVLRCAVLRCAVLCCAVLCWLC